MDIIVEGNSGQNTESQTNKGATKGFASMDQYQQKEIARKGGLTVSKNRAHMAEIGRKGGLKSVEARKNKTK
jgi:general stress protein YciG